MRYDTHCVLGIVKMTLVAVVLSEYLWQWHQSTRMCSAKAQLVIREV